jgi:hypothetical protein
MPVSRDIIDFSGELMNSGIYLLKFQCGDTYIGQAKDFQQRWARHDKEMLAGTHTKLVQAAYRRSGERLPTKHKIVECHQDWLDYYEALLILQEAPPLNTQSPRPMPERVKAALVAHLHSGGAGIGMLDNLEQFRRVQEELEAARGELETLWTREDELEATLRAQVESSVQAELVELREEAQCNLEWACGMRAELEELRAYRRRVEDSGWWGRLWANWS